MNVEIAGLTRRFGRNQAVAGVDLQAGPGVFGLLGPNGAGKTSLLRTISGLIRPTRGTIRFESTPFQNLRADQIVRGFSGGNI